MCTLIPNEPPTSFATTRTRCLLEPEMEREDALHHVRRLGRVVDRQVAPSTGRNRRPAPRGSSVTPGMAAEMEGLLDHRVGLRVGRVDVARGVLPLPGEVVAELGRG